MACDHRTVYDALEAKFGKNTSETNPLTYLYEQQPDSAVLYSPDSKTKACREYPLHLHPGRESWQPEVYRAILPSIELWQLEKKSADQADDRFLLWKIVDWDGFAKALGLTPMAVS